MTAGGNDRHLDTETLSAYLDGALPGPEHQAAAAHLAACGRCREELEALRSVVAAVRSLPALRPPRSLALTPEQVRPRRRWPLFAGLPTFQPAGTVGALRLASAVAVLLLAALLVVDAGNVGTGRSGTPDGAASPLALESRTSREAGMAAPAAPETADATAGAGERFAPGDAQAPPGTTQQDAPQPVADAAGGGAGQAAPAAVEEEPAPPQEPAAADGDAGGTLRRAQMAMALAAAGLLAASFVAGRRRTR